MAEGRRDKILGRAGRLETAETRKVLEMLAGGKITAEEADKLLEKLAGGGGPGIEEGQTREQGSQSQKRRFLRIVVDSPDREQVNIRVPLAFMRTGMKLLAVLPPRVSERLAEKGVDLSALGEMKAQDLNEALEELGLDVEGRDGKKVRIFCE